MEELVKYIQANIMMRWLLIKNIYFASECILRTNIGWSSLCISVYKSKGEAGEE